MGKRTPCLCKASGVLPVLTVATLARNCLGIVNAFNGVTSRASSFRARSDAGKLLSPKQKGFALARRNEDGADRPRSTTLASSTGLAEGHKTASEPGSVDVEDAAVPGQDEFRVPIKVDEKRWEARNVERTKQGQVLLLEV
ncbi:unnamed protein product [Choristocarpus tenellus]